jgi:hypothetical protein
MKCTFKYLIILCILFLSCPVFGEGVYDHVTYYVLLDETRTIHWDECTGNNVKYDVYLKRFEWDEVVKKYIDILTNYKEVIFPTSGMYIIMVRARYPLTSDQTEELLLLTKEELIQKAIEWHLVEDVGNTVNLSADQLRDIMIGLGKASEWATSISSYGMVNGVQRSWWVYSYISSPGPIVISNLVKKLKGSKYNHGQY